MGLFENFTKNKEKDEPFTPEEAFAGILLAVAASDGHLSDQEAATFCGVAGRMRLYSAMPDEVFSAMMDRLTGVIKRDSVGALLGRSVAALPAELRDTAFAIAVDLVLADGEVEDEEQAVIEALQEALEIPDELARNIVEVMIIRNKG